jgi:hypothetical protein
MSVGSSGGDTPVQLLSLAVGAAAAAIDSPSHNRSPPLADSPPLPGSPRQGAALRSPMLSPGRASSLAAEAAALALSPLDFDSGFVPVPVPLSARLAARGSIMQPPAPAPGSPPAMGSRRSSGRVRRGRKPESLEPGSLCATPSGPLSPAFYPPLSSFGAASPTAMAPYAGLSYAAYSPAASSGGGGGDSGVPTPLALPMQSPAAPDLASLFTSGGQTPAAAAPTLSKRAARASRKPLAAGGVAPAESAGIAPAGPASAAGAAGPAGTAKTADPLGATSFSGAASQTSGAASQTSGAAARESGSLRRQGHQVTDSNAQAEAFARDIEAAMLRVDADRSTSYSVSVSDFGAAFSASSETVSATSPTAGLRAGETASAEAAPEAEAAELRDYIETDLFPRLVADEAKPKNRWDEGDASRVKVRGKNYMDDGIKFTAAPPAFQTLGMVVVRTAKPLKHCAARLPILKAFLEEQAANFPYFVIFTWMLPGDSSLTVIQVCGRTLPVRRRFSYLWDLRHAPTYFTHMSRFFFFAFAVARRRLIV